MQPRSPCGQDLDRTFGATCALVRVEGPGGAADLNGRQESLEDIERESRRVMLECTRSVLEDSGGFVAECEGENDAETPRRVRLPAAAGPGRAGRAGAGPSATCRERGIPSVERVTRVSVLVL